jgi:hypothetical protein
MQKINEEEVRQYIDKNYQNTPLCTKCCEIRCYIIVDTRDEENKQYYYSLHCNNCSPNHTYIADADVNNFIESKFTSSPLCTKCNERNTFIKIDAKGRYFSKECAYCIVNRIF